MGPSRAAKDATILLVLLVAVPSFAIAASLLGLSHAPDSAVANRTEPVTVSSILLIGSRAEWTVDVLAELEFRSGLVAMTVMALSDLAGTVGQLNNTSIVLFQSEWLIGKVREPQLLDFLRAVVPTEAKIVAAGGETSLLFDSLNEVRAVFAEGRNPGYDDPPVAGYKLRAAISRDGTTYYGSSMLFCNTADAISAADGILRWR